VAVVSGRHEVRWMFHSTAMVVDYDATCDALARLGGLRVMEYSESMVPEVGRRGGMTWIGDNSIEIGQPIVAGGGADRFVRRTGGGVHSVAVQVADVEATIAHLEASGTRVAARPDPDFCFSDPRDTGGVFFEWFAGAVPQDPRYGGELPPYTVAPLLEVTHHAFIGAVVDDPLAWASRYAGLLGTAVTFEDPTAPPGSPMAGVSLADNTLALYALAPEASEGLWGREYARARTHVIGFRVPDLDEAARLLAGSGVGLVRRDERFLVVEPAVTGGAGTVFVEDLLPGDPRR
jgi:Glyoxalase/Bleomycin resistance protein/Dioxygenase superfamily